MQKNYFEPANDEQVEPAQDTKSRTYSVTIDRQHAVNATTRKQYSVVAQTEEEARTLAVAQAAAERTVDDNFDIVIVSVVEG
jgi:hypothetical protein